MHAGSLKLPGLVRCAHAPICSCRGGAGGGGWLSQRSRSDKLFDFDGNVFEGGRCETKGIVFRLVAGGRVVLIWQSSVG